MTTDTYNPEPGSPAARALDLLARNPEDDYTSGDLALKFQVKATAWPPLLAKAKAAGLVTYAAAGEDDPKAWSAGPAMAAWWAARNAQAAVPRGKRGGARPLLPVPDLATLKVEHGVPIAPRRIGQPGDSRWAPVLAMLEGPDTSIALPMNCRGAIGAYIKKASKAGRLPGSYVVRPCAIEIGKCRVHRTG